MKNNKKNLKNKSVKNYKNSVLRRNIITLSSSFVLMIVALIATILVLNKHIDEKKFMAYEGYYSSDQSVIDGTGAPAQQYIKMSEFYTISNNTVSPTSTTPGTKYITIETKADLYAFSKLCN